MSTLAPSPNNADSGAGYPESKKSGFTKRFTSKNRNLKHALGVLSKDMQGSLGNLTSTVERMNRYEPQDIEQLKRDLQEQLSRLNEGMSLLGTMLETNSSEILKYVKKRRRPLPAQQRAMINKKP